MPIYQAAEDADLSALNIIPELLLIAALIREMRRGLTQASVGWLYNQAGE